MSGWDELDDVVDEARERIAWQREALAEFAQPDDVSETTLADQAAIRDFDFRRRVAWLTPTRDWRNNPDFYEENSE